MLPLATDAIDLTPVFSPSFFAQTCRTHFSGASHGTELAKHNWRNTRRVSVLPSKLSSVRHTQPRSTMSTTVFVSTTNMLPVACQTTMCLP